ncbi:MAG TPA: amidohydrolase family protein [Gaiellaceae bacterium]|nr:amidohydrolase family protein [Gaiellaceae bacterium]
MRVLSADWVVPVEGEPIRDGAVAIEDGRIAAVGPASELGVGERHPEAVILPGFVNAHSHLEYAVYAGFGDGLPFGPWLSLHVERKRRLELADMEAIARLGAYECLRSGITTVGDASFSGAAALACSALGLRGIVYLEVFGDASNLAGRFEPLRERIAGTLSQDVRLGISPHAPYTCTLDLYAACAELGLPIVTHLAESEAETDWLLSGSGAWRAHADLLVPSLGTTGIRALAEAGLLGPSLVAAHCVQADEEEIALLARHDVAVAHCPRSNALLGCGIAPLAALREAGIRVALATDSPASTPSFDMFEELRTAIYAARARERRPDALTAREALELATLGGARALGLADEVGSLRPGKRADLTVLSLAGSPFLPWEDPVTATVLGGSPERVVATLVSGRPRYERGGTTWPELIDAARSARARLLSPAAR